MAWTRNGGNTTTTLLPMSMTGNLIKTNATDTNWPYLPIQPKQGLILFLITLPGCTANVIAFLATSKLAHKQRNNANYFVMALIITDFYGITFCTLPTLLCYLMRKWIGGMGMCNFQGVSTMFASLASGSLATAMAVERLAAVWKPLWYRAFATRRKTLVTIATLWSIAIVIALIPVAREGNFVRNGTGTYCTINWFAKSKENIAYAISYAVMGVSLLVIVVFCNISIAIHLWQAGRKRELLRADSTRMKLMSRKSDAENGNSTEEKNKVKRKDSSVEKLDKIASKSKPSSSALEKQLSKTVAAISILFIICWAPFMIRIICNLTGVWVNAWVDVQVSRLLLLNFVLDPFLYTLSRKQCRDIVKGWLCCCCSSKRLRRSLLSSKFFSRMRKKHGSFLSSNQTGSGTNLNSTTSTSNIQMSRIKSGSVISTPDPSVSTDAVVVHVSGNHEPGSIPETKQEVNAQGSNSESSKDDSSDDLFRKCHSDASAFKKPQMQRLHSEMAATNQTGLQEKTSSLPNLFDADNHDESEDVKVDIGYMYDLAFQRQKSK